MRTIIRIIFAVFLLSMLPTTSVVAQNDRVETPAQRKARLEREAAERKRKQQEAAERKRKEELRKQREAEEVAQRQREAEEAAQRQREAEELAQKQREEEARKKREAEEALERERMRPIRELEANMILVEGGTFMMGGTKEQGENVTYYEKPVHQVTLSSFKICKYEVTQELWLAIMGSNPSKFKGSKCPVENVSWDDCQQFIEKLNLQTDRHYRLPTEAEWEFAARGGNHSQGYRYAGGNNLDDVAWYSDNSGKQTHDVGTKRANELGLYDMTGNVNEWVQDYNGLYPSCNQTNPIGPYSGSSRIWRGGDNNSIDMWCHISCRAPLVKSYGLRLVEENTYFQTDEEYKGHERQRILHELESNMIYVEGGTFLMGAECGRWGDRRNEEPVHQVTLSSFRICKYEVTQELWQAVMDSNPSKFKDPMHPVEQVSWNDCKKFISKLNLMTGKNYRLPTEAEWEYAARGGCRSEGYLYSGGNTIDDVAWHKENSYEKCSNSSYAGTQIVGMKRANELGLYDMTGNVEEWCSDWYGSYDSNNQIDPKGPSSGSYVVYRGGSWAVYDSFCRVSVRGWTNPTYSSDRIGLRLVL